MNHSFTLARLNMLRNQLLPSVALSQEMAEAITAVPRELFVPEAFQGAAYVDEPLQLFKDRFLLSPVLFCQLASLARLSVNDTILDIAPGTGYSSAVFSKFCNKVIALESHPELASKANHLLHQLDIHNVIMISSNLAEGYPEAAPYNVIFINGAVSTIPETLTNQLAEGGRLIAIVPQETGSLTAYRAKLGNIVVVERTGNSLSKKILFPVSYASLLPL